MLRKSRLWRKNDFLMKKRVFTILISIVKLTGKRADQADFCERLMYLYYLLYRTTNQLQKKFQDGSTVIEAKQLLENVLYDGKKKFAVR